MRVLKKKLQADNIFQELRRREYYESRGTRRRRERNAAKRRQQRDLAKGETSSVNDLLQKTNKRRKVDEFWNTTGRRLAIDFKRRRIWRRASGSEANTPYQLPDLSLQKDLQRHS